MNLPLVSLVITTKNEEKNIENCLISIREQSYSNIQIIVVDNFSTDKTKEIALKYTSFVFDKGPERSAQRNFGMIEIAKGEYVMFIDADMILSPFVVEECSLRLRSGNELMALHIPEIVLGRNFFSKVRRFERTFYDGTVVDGARFFRKDSFVNVGGFDESMSGPEDWDIDKKIKQIGKIGLLNSNPNKKEADSIQNWKLHSFVQKRGVNPNMYSSVIYHNEAEFDLKKYLSKKGYYAKSFDGYIEKWGKNDIDIRKQFGLLYRFFFVFLEDGKWMKLIKHPFLTFGMYFLRFLVGIKFIFRKK